MKHEVTNSTSLMGIFQPATNQNSVRPAHTAKHRTTERHDSTRRLIASDHSHRSTRRITDNIHHTSYEQEDKLPKLHESKVIKCSISAHSKTR